VVRVTRLDRLAGLTSDLSKMLAAITEEKAAFRSLGDTWADTTAPQAHSILTELCTLRSSNAISSAPALARIGNAPSRPA
jgi:hypothetical protein